MIERDFYKPCKEGLSCKNEPSHNLEMTCDVRLYPDMLKAYDSFSKFFNIPMDSFILANGCENAIKNTLLAIKPKEMCWFVPTWGMLDVYCEALNIKQTTFNFDFSKEKNFFQSDFLYIMNYDVIYTNCGYTNFFSYKFDNKKLNKTKTRYNICDITYQNLEQMKTSIKELKENPRNIIIGSFDKMFGCGLRLGFTIFNKELYSSMSLQREQFINTMATNFLIYNDKDYKEPFFKQEIKEILKKNKNNCITDNYITILNENNKDFVSPNRKFELDSYSFVRFGMPNNKEEFNLLKKDLELF